MRLIKPSPGEVVDRQTILELKIKYGSQGSGEMMMSESWEKEEKSSLTRDVLTEPSKINIQPFIDENEQLQRYLEKDYLPFLPNKKGELYDKYLEELAQINEQVWKLMDQAHTLNEAPDKMQEVANQRAAEVLFGIVDLNDKRAVLVDRINGLFGIQVTEKIYA